MSRVPLPASVPEKVPEEVVAEEMERLPPFMDRVPLPERLLMVPDSVPERASVPSAVTEVPSSRASPPRASSAPSWMRRVPVPVMEPSFISPVPVRLRVPWMVREPPASVPVMVPTSALPLMVRPPPSRVRVSRVFDAPLRTMFPSRRARVSTSIVPPTVSVPVPSLMKATLLPPVMLPPMTVSWPAGSMSSSPVVICLLLRMTTAVPSPVLLTTRLLPVAPIRLLILAPCPSDSPGAPARLTVRVWPPPMTTPA